MVLTVILAETHAEERLLERTPPIQARPVKKGARRINRRSWAKQQGGGVDDHVLIVRVREQHRRRDKRLATKAVMSKNPLDGRSQDAGHDRRKSHDWAAQLRPWTCPPS